MTLASKRIVLVVVGGIAAYKALDLIRRLKERGAVVVPVMTKGAQEFVTPLAVGALAGGHVRLAVGYKKGVSKIFKKWFRRNIFVKLTI